MRTIAGGILLLAGAALHAAGLDRNWFRQALTEEAAQWRAAAYTPNGFFQPSLDRQWRPASKQTGTLVSQCRQMFVMAAGYEVTRDAAYLEALRKGSDFLLAHFRDTEYGGYFFSTAPDGKVLDDSKDSYGHAFVIFGLSHAARVTGDARYREAALAAWAEMKRHFRDGPVFLKPRLNRDFTQARGVNSQNPMMHLFEALLALHDATGSREVHRDARALAEAIFTRLFQDQGGYLPEFYDSEWKPSPPDKRGHIDLGHQFEWAFLLSHAVEKGFPKQYLKTGGRLLDYGMKIAWDPEAGGVYSRGSYDGVVVKEPKMWWQQAEHLRAVMHYAALRGRADLWPAFDKSLGFVKRNFIDSEYGGWYFDYDPDRPREEKRAHKGIPTQVGYHVAGFYAEGLRLSERKMK